MLSLCSKYCENLIFYYKISIVFINTVEMVWDPSLLYMGWIHGLKTSSQILIKCNRTSFHYHIMEFRWILKKQEDVRNISLWRWYSFWNWSSRSYHQFYGNVERLTHYDRRNVCYRYAEMLKCKICVEWAYFSL